MKGASKWQTPYKEIQQRRECLAFVEIARNSTVYSEKAQQSVILEWLESMIRVMVLASLAVAS